MSGTGKSASASVEQRSGLRDMKRGGPMGHSDGTFHKALREVSIDDKYELSTGQAYLSGTQAFVRLLINQAQRDKAAGWNTGGFVSGYRGSPLAGIDQALWSAAEHLTRNAVHFQPGINEDLAATACWGTQQLMLFPDEATVEGVFTLWYGKGPGVDRSGDALKHANGAGTSPKGGALVLAADDHTAKSSTFGHQSEHALVAAFIPVLYPSSVQEYLDLGVHGWAMSRFAGLWVGMKCVSDVVETTSIADVDPYRVKVRTPDDSAIPSTGVHIRWPDVWAEQEPRLVRVKLPAALAYCRANGLNRIEFKGAGARLGIVCAGKSYNDTRQALRLLSLSEEQAAERGVALLKLGMVWPLEPAIIREFAAGLDEILVIEEKRALIEQQIKDLLYADAGNGSPVPKVTGKTDGGASGEFPAGDAHVLLRSDLELTPLEVASAIASRMRATLGEQSAPNLHAVDVARGMLPAPAALRKPYFCSGCPHNTSTKVPEGSRATAGIGCHYMANWMDRATETYTHMGGEGVPWVAQRLFSKRKHVFANMGDGTYFHSGSLAVRQAVSAGVNMTFKVLFNDAVAMTGGQSVDGPLTVERLVQQLHAEGAVRVAVVSDDIEKYSQANIAFAPGTTVHHRGELDAVQRDLREISGVSALVYDQTCASEKRRRRKRKEYPDPPKRLVINPEVCEGCGDCSAKSNCLSVEPLDTPLGRKRRINQSSCNKDYSCAEGFCPSFVAIEGGELRKGVSKSPAPTLGADGDPALWEGLPEPMIMPLGAACNLLVNGVGGTGVVTIGNILGMAAHLSEGHATVLDMAGLAQKGGAVWSHVRIAGSSGALDVSRIAAGQADVMIGCDLVVSAQPDSLSKLSLGRTRAVLNSDTSPTADFVRNPDWNLPELELRSAVEQACGVHAVSWVPAHQLAVKYLGDSVFANAIMLGHAWQRGLVPLSLPSLERAILLNGQAVQANLKAFRIGRWHAHDGARVERTLSRSSVVRWTPRTVADLDGTVSVRRRLLVEYQDERYASRYEALVGELCAMPGPPTPNTLAVAIACNLYKLMAYKDEYEVARLHSSVAFLASVQEQFAGEYKLAYYLAPPLISRRNARGELQKRRFGPWVRHAFSVLAALKRLRGSPFDVFGWTAERRIERELINEYAAALRLALPHQDKHPKACLELAQLPQQIRGYGHVKEASIARARARQRVLLTDICGDEFPHRPDTGYDRHSGSALA